MIESHRNDFCYAIGLPIMVSKRSERAETALVGLRDKANKLRLNRSTEETHTYSEFKIYPAAIQLFFYGKNGV